MTQFDLGGTTLGLMPSSDIVDLLDGRIEPETGQRAELHVPDRTPRPPWPVRWTPEGSPLSYLGPTPWGETVGYVPDPDGRVLAVAKA